MSFFIFSDVSNFGDGICKLIKRKSSRKCTNNNLYLDLYLDLYLEYSPEVILEGKLLYYQDLFDLRSKIISVENINVSNLLMHYVIT